MKLLCQILIANASYPYLFEFSRLCDNRKLQNMHFLGGGVWIVHYVTFFDTLKAPKP
jgi:hypothetical protein